MTVTGISGNLYYINNPILIDIKDLAPQTEYLEIWLTNQTLAGSITTIPVRLYPNVNKEIIDYDLAELVKANFPRPKHPTGTIGNNTSIGTNYTRFNILIYQYGASGNQIENDSYSQSRTFLRGGEDSQRVNVSGNVGDVLADTDKLLLWGGLPISKYFINSNREIAVTTNISGSEIQQMKVIGYDPFYIRFLNKKGGYSYWLFPVWEKSKKTKSEGFVKRSRANDSFSLGYTTDHTIKAESRIRKEHYRLAESLVSSQEIHVYNRYGMQWAKIAIKDTTFVENTYEDIAELNVEFELNFNHNERLIW